MSEELISVGIILLTITILLAWMWKDLKNSLSEIKKDLKKEEIKIKYGNIS